MNTTSNGLAAPLLSLILLGAVGKAETPERIFERVSPSVAVVEVSDAAGKPVGQGSGVVIGPGAVITHCHVAEDGARLRVTRLGKTFAATLQYADTDRDLRPVEGAEAQRPGGRPGSHPGPHRCNRRLFLTRLIVMAQQANPVIFQVEWAFPERGSCVPAILQGMWSPDKQ